MYAMCVECVLACAPVRRGMCACACVCVSMWLFIVPSIYNFCKSIRERNDLVLTLTDAEELSEGDGCSKSVSDIHSHVTPPV